MNNLRTNYYQNRIILLLLIAVGGLCYAVILFLNRSANQNFTSLAALKSDTVSDIEIYNSTESQKSLLLTLNNPKDNEIINQFVDAINATNPSDMPDRELILSHELYTIIKLKNERKTFELLLHLHKSCGNAVYIDIVKKPGGVESNITSYIGSAKAEAHLYKWLQNMNLSKYLGCD